MASGFFFVPSQTRAREKKKKRVRRGLFGQSLVDFSTESWSSIQLKESAKDFAAQ